MVSYLPRKQRKMLYNAPKHKRQKMMKSHLSDELYGKYGLRSLTVRKGDIVKVMRGKFKGHEGKVVKVNLKNMRVAVEGVTVRKVDNKAVQYWIHPSNLMLIKLDLSDPKRKEKIYKLAEEKRGVSIEELEESEEVEAEEEEEKEEEKEEEEVNENE
ncbi:50S ribosomal protein L24 [Candidatus Aciduliprofundum boonei]|uniref:Large ribosomal subunit protein uL24 n=1 Tax=Aciduliprofundum boonei (strain DSM 19572 / T469) TaxID=439481 RepID=D3TB37_ACIB4|nr:ribosomal protein L24 [Aciduliprofundum boonei T469]